MDYENVIALINKTDLGQVIFPSDLPFTTILEICAQNGHGLSQLSQVIDTMFAGNTPCDGSVLTNPRQFDAIARAYESMLSALQGLKLGLTPDAVLTDVENAMEAKGEVTGAAVRAEFS